MKSKQEIVSSDDSPPQVKKSKKSKKEKKEKKSKKKDKKKQKDSASEEVAGKYDNND